MIGLLSKVKIYLDFRVWGTGGWVVGIKLVLRVFPELVGRSVQNLVEFGVAVQKRDTGTYIGRYKRSVLYL